MDQHTSNMEGTLFFVLSLFSNPTRVRADDIFVANADLSSKNAMEMAHVDNYPGRRIASTRSWKVNHKRQIDALNEQVEKFTKVAIANVEKSGKPLDPEYVYAQQSMTTMVAAYPIYQIQSAFIVYLYSLESLG